MWATRAASSAKRRSWISLYCVLVWAWRRRRLKRLPSRRYLTYTPSSSSKSSVAFFSIMLKKMLKRVGARTQPCFTPLETGKGSDRSPLSLTWPRWFSCSWITICRNFGGQPSRSRMSHSPVLLTVSNAFVRSTKVAYSPMFCSRHFS